MPNKSLVGDRTVLWTMVPVDRLPPVDAWWKRTLARAAVDATFRAYVEGHEAAAPAGPRWMRSLVLAAIQFPPRRVGFESGGRKLSIILPPAYYSNTVRRDRVLGHLSDALSDGGPPARVEHADAAPLKLLAASSGLGAYGRNNIVYAGALGSAISLAAFWTDAEARVPESDRSAPIHRDPFEGPAGLPACAACSRCVAGCPTGAIPPEFGLIDAGRCISLWNETDRDLPDFVPPGAPNALTGCVLCQAGCPANAAAWADPPAIPALSARETELVLRGEWGGELRTALARTLSTDDEEELRAWAPVARRNLAAFIGSGRTA